MFVKAKTVLELLTLLDANSTSLVINYGCGLLTATIEYSCPICVSFVCLSDCVQVK